jgi:hypothetical protein
MMQVVHLKSNKSFSLSKAAFNKKDPLFTSKLDLNVRKKLVKTAFEA